MRENARNKRAMKSAASAMGRVTKMSIPPWEIVNDCRRAVCSNGPKMKARIKGPPSYSNFFMK